MLCALQALPSTALQLGGSAAAWMTWLPSVDTLNLCIKNCLWLHGALQARQLDQM